MEIDFWGNVVKDTIQVKQKHPGYCQRFKIDNNYHKAEKGAYQNCGVCTNFMKRYYHNKNYYKCKQLGDSYSETTDIRKSYVCNKFDILIKDGIT